MEDGSGSLSRSGSVKGLRTTISASTGVTSMKGFGGGFGPALGQTGEIDWSWVSEGDPV